MQVSEFVAKTYLAATGEVSTLVSTDDDYKKILSIGNTSQIDWAHEPGTDWESLYDPAYPIGTVSATDTFDLDDEIDEISNKDGDSIRIVHSDGVHFTDYQTVAPNQLKLFPNGQFCARVGQTLKFNKAFTADDAQFGGTINVPCYVLPDTLVNPTDTISVDNPNWLVYISGAEFVRNDITLQQQYPNLIAKATDAMNYMKAANTPQVATIPKTPIARSTEW